MHIAIIVLSSIQLGLGISMRNPLQVKNHEKNTINSAAGLDPCWVRGTSK
jgi:hypothetical protein